MWVAARNRRCEVEPPPVVACRLTSTGELSTKGRRPGAVAVHLRVVHRPRPSPSGNPRALVAQACLASALSLAVVTSLGAAASAPSSAAGPDAATTAVTDLFGRLASGFVPQVAFSTALAQQQRG